jgi:hypothetical protein
LLLFWRAAREQEFLPARAYVMTHDWCNEPMGDYDSVFGVGALQRDSAADEYVRLRLACYRDGHLALAPDMNIYLALFRECVARNLPVPGDLAALVMSRHYPWDAEAPALLKRLALRGMAWAQVEMGALEGEQAKQWMHRAARNGDFFAAWTTARVEASFSENFRGAELFERALYLDWFAAWFRRPVDGQQRDRMLMTVAYMKRRVTEERQTAPLRPTEIYHFGRAAHYLLRDAMGNEPVRPKFEFWHKLGASYRACIRRHQQLALAFLGASSTRRARVFPKDLARIIGHYIWESRIDNAVHDTYPLGLRGKKQLKRG